ncbi:hypothetical protein TcG_10919 [Trypanosoma cruzi]|nr:hypothetical protein TcBrA4_0130000 [Trypanosoma cruzi]RNF03909.1 hypothetical protein TcG_10919 [Trypanosoma cruzi]
MDFDNSPISLVTWISLNFIPRLHQCLSDVRFRKFCNEAISVSSCDEGTLNCSGEKRVCYICCTRVTTSTLSQPLRECASCKGVTVYFGASLVAFKFNTREECRPLVKGILG